jgi:hypothetical protein
VVTVAANQTKYTVSPTGRRALLASSECPLSQRARWDVLHGDDPAASDHVIERYEERTSDLGEIPPVAVAVDLATTDAAIAQHPHFDYADERVHVHHGRDGGRTWGMVFPETASGVIPTTYRIRSVDHGPLRAYLWALENAGGYW